MRWSINKIVMVVLLALMLFGLMGLYRLIYDKESYYKTVDIALKERVTEPYLDQKIADAIALR